MESSALSTDSAKDLTPALQIVTWLLQCISVLIVLVKIGTKLRFFRDFSQDDIATLIALVWTSSPSFDALANDCQVIRTGQCVAGSLQNAHGFGQHRVALGEGQIEAALKVNFI